VLGTLSYMAPEQARGERATGASDVWAAALTLYARLAGRNPYRAKSLGELLERFRDGCDPLTELRPDLPRDLTRTVMRGLRRDPARRPTAAEFRDGLLTALRPVEEPEAERPQLEAVPRPPQTVSQPHRIPLPEPLVERGVQAAGSIIAAGTVVWTLGAFPVYPPLWTLPLALLVGGLAWKRPSAALGVMSAILVPAFWNHAEAAGITWIAMSAVWIRSTRNWGRGRCLSPLLAGPLALVGLGPAYVVVAATASTPRRRAAEAVAGGIVMLVAGNMLTHHALRGVAGADLPTALGRALARQPQAIAMVTAMAVFAVLLPEAWNRRGDRRLQAVVLWGLGFALAVAGLPQLVAEGHNAWAPAAAAATVAAIIPAAWALASPRFSLSR